MRLAHARELRQSRSALIATGVVSIFSSFYFLDLSWSESRLEILGFIITLPLLYGSLVYQLTRLGALRRERAHFPLSFSDLQDVFKLKAPQALTILIPSYKEEPRVLRQTLLSAALTEYPGREVVVLIDDPIDDLDARRSSKRVVEDVAEMLAAPATVFKDEYAQFLSRQKQNGLDLSREAARLAKLYRQASDHFRIISQQLAARADDPFAHVDRFFLEFVLDAPAKAHAQHANAIESDQLSKDKIVAEYARLASLFAANISGFERKRYVNLSHAPNKAMNLNAYIGLLGKTLREQTVDDAIELVECTESEATLCIAAADFVLTLDADSMIASDYALRLMHVMRNNPRVAVAQTPYSSFPGAPSGLERAAAATTDIQYFTHQGSAEFNAGYWVGANALLRVDALRAIETNKCERGFAIPIFIQERTVIEDTGSTIDLIRQGWSVYNYPERLAYSATPSDFGALIVQRRRWSNGGLIILPDLLRHVASSIRNGPAALIEAFVRIHYLISPATGSVCVLALLLCPLDPLVSGILLPLAAAPYYYLYGRDLVRAGYGWSELLRVYALTLILLPVNLAGVTLSLVQIVTGRKSSFGRTPKIADRTAIPLYYVVFNALLFVAMLISAAYSVGTAHFARAIFPVVNAAFYGYGIAALMRVGHNPTHTIAIEEGDQAEALTLDVALATSARAER